MGDFFHPMTTQAARKVCQCECCYYAIEKGERYAKQSGVYDGSYYTNRFHMACWDALVEEAGYGEFECSGSGEPPEGARTMQAARAAASQGDRGKT